MEALPTPTIVLFILRRSDRPCQSGNISVWIYLLHFLELFSVRFCLPGSLNFKKYLPFLLIFFWSSLVPEFCLWNFLLSFYPFIIFQFSWTSYIFGVSAVLWILKKYNTCFHLWIWFHSYLSCFPLLVSILFSILSASHILFVNLSPPSLPTCWDVWWFLHQVMKSHVDSQCFARKGLPCRVSMQRLGWFPRALQLSVFSWNGQLREEISTIMCTFPSCCHFLGVKWWERTGYLSIQYVGLSLDICIFIGPVSPSTLPGVLEFRGTPGNFQFSAKLGKKSHLIAWGMWGNLRYQISFVLWAFQPIPLFSSISFLSLQVSGTSASRVSLWASVSVCLLLPS